MDQNDMIMTASIRELLTVEQIAEIVAAGWIYVGTFFFAGDVNQIVVPGEPPQQALPRHVWAREPGVLTVPNMIGAVMAAADKHGDSPALDMILTGMIGKTVQDVRDIMDETAAMQRKLSGVADIKSGRKVQ